MATSCLHSGLSGVPGTSRGSLELIGGPPAPRALPLLCRSPPWLRREARLKRVLRMAAAAADGGLQLRFTTDTTSLPSNPDFPSSSGVTACN